MRQGGAPADSTTHPDRSPPRQPSRRVPLVAITSGKGGVGKTTLAVNLSIALAARALRVTLVDADLGMANADVMCGLNPTRRLDRVLADAQRPIADLGVKAPGGFTLIPGAAGVAYVAGMDADRYEALLGRLHGLASSADVVLIDTGAGVGPGVTTFCRGADLTLVVVTPEPTSIADAYAMLKCLAREGNGTRVLPGLVVNQVTGIEEARAVHARIAGVAERFLGARPALLGWVPADAGVSGCIRKRVPLALASPKSPAAIGIARFAAILAKQLGLDKPPISRAPKVLRALSGFFGLRNGPVFASHAAGVV